MQFTSRKFLVFITMLAFTTTHASQFATSPTRAWLKQNKAFALEKLALNISPADAIPGAVVAARTKANPNYYYHWVRDAALVMDALMTTYQTTENYAEKDLIRWKVFEYLDFTIKIQTVKTLADLGEPKFNVDGTAYAEPWGRPQNDGPALRAISLMHWGNILIANGEKDIVAAKMYSNTLPALSPIKKDLEYVSHHWRDPSFDLWEEVKGEHFYTLMVERKALLEGATFAKQMQDPGAAQWYDSQAKEISLELNKFWDASKGYFVATINRVGGLDYKTANLDISVLLGLLHGDTKQRFIDWNDQRITATINAIVKNFASLYPINQHNNIPGVAIGRYPEDRYAGANFTGGNPWPLCTLAVAESLYRYAKVEVNLGHIQTATDTANLADQFVERVRYHANKDGSLNEQMDKNTGYMTSVEDLSWNYAALLTVGDSAGS